MNCTLCNKKIEETFLKKILGTYVRDDKGKRKAVCQTCQKQHSLSEIRKKLQ